ncbi:MAG: site-specific DNA-methyltransferase, partial [Bacteroidia bacterium]|nr:site-specific DNA-methyltransferase [Bacteroidia bacterium]
MSNPRGRDYGGIARMHDYIIVYSKSENYEMNRLRDENKQFDLFDNIGGFELRELRNRNIKFNFNNRPNLYYPFYVNPNYVDENGLYEVSLEKKAGWIEVYPAESQGVKTVWRWGKQKSKENLNINVKARKMPNGNFQIVEKYREEKVMARSVWWDKDANTERGT